MCRMLGFIMFWIAVGMIIGLIFTGSMFWHIVIIIALIIIGYDMAKCAVCEKGAHFGNAVSHSHRRSNKIWNSNVKSVRVKVNGATKKMYVCTSCLRSGKVERA